MFKFVLYFVSLSFANSTNPVDMSLLYPGGSRGFILSSLRDLPFGTPTDEMLASAYAVENLPVQFRIYALEQILMFLETGLTIPRNPHSYFSSMLQWSFIDRRLFELLARFAARKSLTDEHNLQSACDIVSYMRAKYSVGFEKLTPDYVMMWYRFVGLPELELYPASYQDMSAVSAHNTPGRILLKLSPKKVGSLYLESRIKRLKATGYETEIAAELPRPIATPVSLSRIATKLYGDICLMTFEPHVTNAEYTAAFNRSEFLRSLGLTIMRRGARTGMKIGDLSLVGSHVKNLYSLISSIPRDRRSVILSSIASFSRGRNLHLYANSFMDQNEVIYARYTLSFWYIPEFVLGSLFKILHGAELDNGIAYPVSASELVKYFAEKDPSLLYLTPDHILEWYRILSTSHSYSLKYARSETPAAISMLQWVMSVFKSFVVNRRIRTLETTGLEQLVEIGDQIDESGKDNF